jgi:hypothetical protein
MVIKDGVLKIILFDFMIIPRRWYSGGLITSHGSYDIRCILIAVKRGIPVCCQMPRLFKVAVQGAMK